MHFYMQVMSICVLKKNPFKLKEPSTMFCLMELNLLRCIFYSSMILICIFFLSPNFSGCLKKCLFHCQIVVLFYSEKGLFVLGVIRAISENAIITV